MPNPIDLGQLASELIAFRSTADRPAERRRCFEYLKSLFAGSGLGISEISSYGVDSLLVHRGSQTPKILLFGHYDVVEGEDGQFSAIERDGKLYGRGALDMKSGVAALVSLMLEAPARGWDAALALTGDEETGGFNGIKTLLDGGLRPGCAILPDGGNAPHNVVRKEKGVLWLKVTACGQGAHGSAPWSGDSAIMRLRRALDAIDREFRSLDGHPDDHWVATCNIGRIEGGSAFNRVPDSACASCDIRYTENDDPQAILELLRRAVPDGTQLETALLEPPVFVAEDDPLVVAYRGAISRAGLVPQFSLDHGSSDARFFTPLGIPVILSQPQGDGLHGPDEWVSVASIAQYRAIAADFLDHTAK